MEKLIKHDNGQWSLASLEKGMGNTKSALGISSEKGLKFDPGFGQSEYREYVEQRADHMSSDGYIAGDANTWNWSYIEDYDIEKLIPIKKDKETWRTWFNGELWEWEFNMGDIKKNHFDKWAKHPETKPIIVAEGLDQRIHILDGHHRLAKMIILEKKTIPVIYGTRKDK